MLRRQLGGGIGYQSNSPRMTQSAYGYRIMGHGGYFKIEKGPHIKLVPNIPALSIVLLSTPESDFVRTNFLWCECT